jgi:DNA-binding NarL/FixJ family response regulator
VIRVAVADDQALVRGGFAVLLGTTDDIEVVGEAADGEAALELVAREHPDVILMDIRMPGTDGVEATERITADERLASTKVLILTMFDLDEYVFAALRAGASGFLLKDTLPEELLAAVRVIAAGESLLSPSVTRRLMEEFVRRPATTPSANPLEGIDLTPRETEVLVAVARGLSNAEIADALFMSHSTAKTHVSRLLTKLSARDRAQLVVLAYEAGIVTPGGD